MVGTGDTASMALTTAVNDSASWTVGRGQRGEFIIELQIEAHARRTQSADQAAQRLLDLPPALLLALHFAQRVVVLLFPI